MRHPARRHFSHASGLRRRVEDDEIAFACVSCLGHGVCSSSGGEGSRGEVEREYGVQAMRVEALPCGWLYSRRKFSPGRLAPGRLSHSRTDRVSALERTDGSSPIPIPSVSGSPHRLPGFPSTPTRAARLVSSIPLRFRFDHAWKSIDSALRPSVTWPSTSEDTPGTPASHPREPLALALAFALDPARQRPPFV